MKAKYIEERYPRWWVTRSTDNREINSEEEWGIATALTALDAQKVVEEQNKLIDVVIGLAQAWNKADPESFKSYWYGEKL